MNLDEALKEFAYLWDGTEPKWYLSHIQKSQWYFDISFAAPGATLKDIQKLRKILPELNALPLPECLKQLRNCTAFQTKRIYYNIEMHQIAEKLSASGFEFNAFAKVIDSYLPVRADSLGLLIEDDELKKIVVEKMLENGCEVKDTVHVD